jgi:uncharacterized delta-60 repeat protein
MRGSVLVAYEEGKQSFGNPLYEITINGTDTRDYQWSEANSLYSTYIFSGNTLTASVRSYGYGDIPYINVSLVEYTNDDVAGDNGLKTTILTGITGNNDDGFLQLSNLPINPSINCYDFIVVVSMGVTQGCAPIGIISGVTGSGTINASTCELKTKNIGVQTQDVGDIYIGVANNSFTVSYYISTLAVAQIGPVFRVTPTYEIDPFFNSRTALGATYSTVNDIEIQNDGRVIVGGGSIADFNTTGYSLNRLTTTGALDGTFTRYNFNGGTESVTDVVQQSDGKIIATGTFSLLNGSTYNNYVRFNYDGTIDNTYYSGGTSTGFGGLVNCEIDVRNNKVYYFTQLSRTYNGSSFGGILRLNTNGTLDTTFNGTGRGGFSFSPLSSGVVNSIKVLPNGQILCIGVFTSYNGQSCPRGIARLNEDGTLDTTFNAGGAGLVFSGFSFIAQPTETLNESENKYLIVGEFSGATYNGVSVPNDIFFLNSDGTLGDNSGLGTGIVGSPKTCKLLPNGNYLITGAIGGFNGTSITNGGMIQLSPTGQLQNC